MGKSLHSLAADPVREKRRKWQQIRVTAFAKKMNSVPTLLAEKCCDSYHQEELRRNGTAVRKHPKRVWRIFIYYSVYLHHIKYDDEEGSAILLHDTKEDVSSNVSLEIGKRHGNKTLLYVETVSRKNDETVEDFIKRVSVYDFTLLLKICDTIDNGLDMLNEYHEGLNSAPIDRVQDYFNEKVRILLEVARKKDLTGLKYEQVIKSAIEDLKLIYQEAQDILSDHN